MIYELMKAEEGHLEQIATLLMSTGYWEADLKYNTLGLNAYDFMRDLIARPHLSYTTIIVEKNKRDKVFGVIICASKQELEAIPADWIDAIDSSVAALFKNLIMFEINNSFHISFISVLKETQGRGLGKILLNYAESKSKEQGFDTLSLYTINCQTNSMKLYLHMGMMITKVITLDERLPFPYVLYFEKSTNLTKLHNYFDTEAYKRCDLLNL